MVIATLPTQAARLVAWDTETFLIGCDSPYPYPVCVSIAYFRQGADWEGDEEVITELFHAQFQQAEMITRIQELCNDPDVTMVTQNGQFDYVNMGRAFPELIPTFIKLHRELRAYDTMVAQRFDFLASYGNPEQYDTALSDLCMLQLGEDISADKLADSVRTRYNEVFDIPCAQWAPEFDRYSRMDASVTLRVAHKQMQSRYVEPQQRAIRHRCEAFYHLGFKTLNGAPVDTERAAALYHKAKVATEYANFPLMLQHDIIHEAHEGPVCMNDARVHEPGCKKQRDANNLFMEEDSKGEMKERKRFVCACPPKRKKAVTKGTSPGKLLAMIANMSAQYGIEAFLTKTGQEALNKAKKQKWGPSLATWNFAEDPPEDVTTKSISRGREEVEMFNNALLEATGSKSAILQEWVALSKFDKVANTYMPRFLWDRGNGCQGSFTLKWLEGKKVSGRKGQQPPENWSADMVDFHWVDTMRFSTNPLVKTGRFSGRQTGLYPSLNGMNLPRDAGVRECITVPEGWVLVAVDYSAMELCSAAWRMRQIFGESRLFDLLAMGRCAHSFLAAQLINYMDRDSECASKFVSRGTSWEECLARQDVLETYKSRKDVFGPDGKTPYYKFWRTLSKPIGLGVWGMMGPARIVETAWKQYGVTISFAQAKEGRDIWDTCFPDGKRYLRSGWLKDKLSIGGGDFSYTSPLGMIRGRCTISAAANGFALQTPSAEGMAEAISRVSESYHDYTQNSILYGCQIIDDVHDEIVSLMPNDEHLTERVREKQRIMEQAMADILVGVPINTEASVMLHYSKDAYEATNEAGRIIPYEQAQA